MKKHLFHLLLCLILLVPPVSAENALSAGLGLSKAAVAAALADCGFAPSVRAEAMTMEQLAALSDRLMKIQ